MDTNLATALAGRLEWSNARRLLVAWNVSGGVSYLHSAHDEKPVLVHRDLKAANTLLKTETLQIKLGDFGLSNVMLEGDEALRLAGGTVGWIAPEVLRHDPSGPERFNRNLPGYNQSADVFSLGVVLWEICTSSTPPQFTATQVCNGARPPWDKQKLTPAVFDLVRPLVESCWSSDPAKRPTAAAVFMSLGDIYRHVQLQQPCVASEWSALENLLSLRLDGVVFDRDRTVFLAKNALAAGAHVIASKGVKFELRQVMEHSELNLKRASASFAYSLLRNKVMRSVPLRFLSATPSHTVTCNETMNPADSLLLETRTTAAEWFRTVSVVRSHASSQQDGSPIRFLFFHFWNSLLSHSCLPNGDRFDAWTAQRWIR